MKYLLLFTLYLCTISITLIAQKKPKEQGNIRGKAMDKAAGTNLVGANLYLMDGKKILKEVIADADGTFLIDQIPIGTYDLVCRVGRYVPQRIEGIDIKMDVSRLAYFRMKQGDDQSEPEVIATYSAVQTKLKTEVSSANQLATALFDAPANIYIITAQDIQERGYMTLIELLNDIPEVEIQERTNAENRNTITFRGVPGSGHILLLLNGIRINSVAGSDGIIDRNISIRYAKQVEIIIGATSALYGADALSGVINIISEEGANVHGIQATSGYGMYNTTDNAFQAGWHHKKMAFNAIGGFYKSSEPMLPKYYKDDFSWYNEHYLKDTTNLMWTGLSSKAENPDTVYFLYDTIKRAKIEPYATPHYAYFAQAQLKLDNLEIGFSHHTEMHSGAFPQYAGASNYTANNIYGISTNNIYAKQNFNLFDDKVKLSTIVNFNRQSINKKTSIANINTLYQPVYQDGFENNIEARQQFVWQIHKNHTLYGGIALVQTHSLAPTPFLQKHYVAGDSIQKLGLYYSGTTVFGDSNAIPIKLYFVNRFSIASSLQYEGNISKKLSFGIGLRLNRIETSQESQFLQYNLSPKFHFIWKVNKHWRLKFVVRSNYLPASIQKQYAHAGAFIPMVDSTGHFIGYVGQFAHLINPKLAAQSNGVFELMASYTKRNLFISTNIYFSNVQNLESNQYNVGSGNLYGVPMLVTERYVNNGDVGIVGLTTQAEYQILISQKRDIRLRLQGSYAAITGSIQLIQNNNLNYNDTTVYNLPFTANHTIKLGATLHYSKFSVYTHFLFRSASYNQPIPNTFSQVSNHPYALLNLFMQYRILDKKSKLNIFVKVNNLLNIRYYNVSESNAFYNPLIAQDPIRIMGGISMEIGRK